MKGYRGIQIRFAPPAAVLFLVSSLQAGIGGPGFGTASNTHKDIHADPDAPEKLLIVSVSDAPDPFSPNGDGRYDQNSITVDGTVRPIDGLKAQGESHKEFFFRVEARILDPLAGRVVRNLSADFHVIASGAKQSRSAVSASATWDGKSNSGQTLPDGTYPYTVASSYVRVDSKTGKEKLIDSVTTDGGTITIDTTPPTFTALSPENGFVSPVPSVQITGTLSEKSTLTINSQSVTLPLDHSFTFDTSLAHGANILTLLAEDAAGNRTMRTLTIIFDNIPPTIQILRPAPDAYVNSATPVIEVTYHDPEPSSGLDLATLSVLVDGHSIVPGDSSSADDPMTTFLSISTFLSDGPHALTASISDRARNGGDAEPVSFTVDTIPPVLSLFDPASGLRTRNPALLVRGAVNEPGEVFVNGVPVPLQPVVAEPISVVPGFTDPPYLNYAPERDLSETFDEGIPGDWFRGHTAGSGGVMAAQDGQVLFDTGLQPVGSEGNSLAMTPGMMQPFDTSQGFTVSVDFALDALQGTGFFGLRLGDATELSPGRMSEFGFRVETSSPAPEAGENPLSSWVEGVWLRAVTSEGRISEQSDSSLSFFPGTTYRFEMVYDPAGATLSGRVSDPTRLLFDRTIEGFRANYPVSVAVQVATQVLDAGSSGGWLQADSRVAVRMDNLIGVNLKLPEAYLMSNSPLRIGETNYKEIPGPAGVLPLPGTVFLREAALSPESLGLVTGDRARVPADVDRDVNAALLSTSFGPRVTVYTHLDRSGFEAFLHAALDPQATIDAFFPAFKSHGAGKSYTWTLPSRGSGPPGPLTFTTPVGLAEGPNLITVTATDLAGNDSLPVSRAVTLDTQPPQIVLNFPASGLRTRDSTIPVRVSYLDSGVGVDLSTLMISLDGVNVTPLFVAPDFVEFQLTPLDGNHTLLASIRDRAGNSAVSAPVSFFVDSTPPVLTLHSPQDGQIFSTGEVLVEGEAFDISPMFATLSLNGVPGIVDSPTPNGHSSFTLPLVDGRYTLEIAVRDDLGNRSVVSASFEVDTFPPYIGIVYPPDGFESNQTEFAIVVAYIDETEGGGVDLSSLQITMDGVDFTPLFPTDLSSVIIIDPIAEGAHTVHASVRDRAGSYAQATPVSFLIDRTPPVVVIDQPAPGSVRETDEVFVRVGYSDVLTGVDPGSLQVVLDGREVTPAERGGAETSFTTHVAPGTHTLEVSIMDRVGNPAEADPVVFIADFPACDFASPPTFGAPERSGGAGRGAIRAAPASLGAGAPCERLKHMAVIRNHRPEEGGLLPVMVIPFDDVRSVRAVWRTTEPDSSILATEMAWGGGDHEMAIPVSEGSYLVEMIVETEACLEHSPPSWVNVDDPAAWSSAQELPRSVVKKTRPDLAGRAPVRKMAGQDMPPIIGEHVSTSNDSVWTRCATNNGPLRCETCTVNDRQELSEAIPSWSYCYRFEQKCTTNDGSDCNWLYSKFYSCDSMGSCDWVESGCGTADIEKCIGGFEYQGEGFGR
ncbi:MAG: hypothetical protein HYT87_18605, partial [Nitrospirae bacterium]|nr:hypothetical protein [Nitrospirota bacterium]